LSEHEYPIPHRCGAVVDSCFLSNNYKILFCDICHRVVGFEKNGVRYIRNFQESKYKKKQYSEETLNDSV
jgi:cysteinyl-tRNA synthetase